MKLRSVVIGFVSSALLASATSAPSLASDQSAQIAAAIAAPDRSETQTARDEARKPADILAFSTIKPGDMVVDLGAGSGYFSRLLSGLVGDEGKVIAQNSPAVLELFGASITPAMESLLSDRDNVVSLTAQLDELELADNSLDAASILMFYHDAVWLPADRAKMNAGVFAALKPGGVFLVTDHHAIAGSGVDAVQSLHRIDAKVVRDDIIAAGFVLEAQSDVLRHPDDDRTLRVFDPTIRGKSDRFVYLFRKAKE
ncbi:MAG: class I SAM-dependent methyltransferase [Robiginitomaculum sp.]|nr:class I SAM-dependent methyltransferase [Robiginitomaculum sp.]